jgi:acyl-CoA synthetase (AMP-forming)/AMP-acid ligase II
VLPLALPAAAAGLAYLNARHGFTYDYPLLSSFVVASVGRSRRERADRLNIFYELEAQAKSSNSSHPWIIYQGQTWTYAQAYNIVLRYGTWLKSEGVEKGDIVAMDFVNSETFVFLLFGLWSLGAKPAFINTSVTGNPLVHTIKTSTARLIIVDEEGRGKYQGSVLQEQLGKQGFTKQDHRPQLDSSELPRAATNQTISPQPLEAGTLPALTQQALQIVFFDKALESRILALPPTRLPDSARADQKQNDIAALIFTSGTTGLPKPAIMSWGKSSSGSKFASSWIALTKKDVLYTSMPLYHSSACVLGLCAVLQAGCTISIGRKFSHKTFWPEIRSSGATMLQYVGETCRYLLAAPPSPLDKNHKLRAAFGNGLRGDVWKPFKERFGIATIYEFYGATEAPGSLWNRSTNDFSTGAVARNGTLANWLVSSGLTVVRMDTESDTPEPIRDPVTGLCLPCKSNEPGELLNRLDAADTSQKFQGYFGNDKASSSKIIRNVKTKGDAYFRSGDLMKWDEEGRWWFVDRLGDTFRWKAQNVSTAEVSEVLGKHPEVAEANVYGVQIPGHDGRAGCAAVVLNSSASAAVGTGKVTRPTPQTLRSIAKHVHKELPAFAQPIWLRFTSEMLTTGTNKQQKHLLKADGIDPQAVERAGDVLYWSQGDTYELFTKRDLERIRGGGVKL